ncbi:MAG: PhoH family protein [Calditrichaeota bacterium]|nr:PhoH family protein [Candidatus Cloacimonadota bacterium]MCA9787683.1 PhoH family protein [Candidatus Cloacimonadota bacterium]MCB1047684.1 PhoH family protein [Calditrichota bacterium]MCB9472958.1 PhoH family protein [Candidatus Delongbacteria bacterium]
MAVRTPAIRTSTFVLDTNVILHDSNCIYKFEKNDLVVPISVLEELDNFKKGNDSLNFHAREFVRIIDSLSGDRLFDKGVLIGPGLGRIRVVLSAPMHKDLQVSFPAQKMDHQILNTAYVLHKASRGRSVVLVTKDVNLRMKAKAVGLPAQDYRNDHVKNIGELYTGHRIEENQDSELINRLYEPVGEIPLADLKVDHPLVPNEYLIMRNNKRSALAVYNPGRGVLRRIDKQQAYGIVPRNAEQSFAMDALLNDDIRLVSVSGKAGTGKTLLALAAALEVRKNYRQILMARPIVPLSNKDLGFLPGDIKSKIDPYMQPLYDNLGVIENQFKESDARHKRIKEYLDQEKLVISPLAYIRGRSLYKVFYIVDEAQNLTPHEIKTIITRAGDNTKMVFTGDIFQIDHPYLNTHSNGLSYLIDRMKGQPLYAHITLSKGERSELADIASDLL